MLRYLARRLLLLVPGILGAALIAFALLLLIPGDPAIALLGQEVSGPELARFRHILGLDRPIPVQFGLYVWRIVQGDFGRSITLHAPVLRLIRSTLPATLELAIASLLLSISVGIPLGLLAPWRRSRAVHAGRCGKSWKRTTCAPPGRRDRRSARSSTATPCATPCCRSSPSSGCSSATRWAARSSPRRSAAGEGWQARWSRGSASATSPW